MFSMTSSRARDTISAALRIVSISEASFTRRAFRMASETSTSSASGAAFFRRSALAWTSSDAFTPMRRKPLTAFATASFASSREETTVRGRPAFFPLSSSRRDVSISTRPSG